VNKCGVIARVRGGVIKKLDPNPHFIKSRGMLCARGNAGLKTVYDADRLKYPLLRVGKRGEGKWKRISWDEAFDYIGEKLTALAEEYTRAGTVFISTEGFQEHFFRMLSESYGSPNTLRHPSLCLSSNIQGYAATYGTNPSEDVLNADYIIFSGSNRSEAFITPDTIDMLKGEGGRRKIVYLDPRFTKTAAKADEWYPVKPGGDMAFILGMINVIVSEELYDKQFVEEMTVGFDKLAPHVELNTPEWAEGECEIAAADIRRLAREFAAAAPRAVYYHGRRSSFFSNDTQMRRAMAILNAIVGNWDKPGGLVPNSKIKLAEHLYDTPWYDDIPERLDKGSVGYLSEVDGAWVPFRNRVLEGKPYPVKGMMVYKQNPVSSVPNRTKTLKMMQQMDFICTIDITMSDTAWFSDIVLPEASYLERTDPVESISGLLPLVIGRNQAVKPLFEAKPNLEIMQGIAKRLGDEVSATFNFTVDEYNEHAINRLPGAHEMLKEKGVYYTQTVPTYGKTNGKRLKTKSGKIELYSAKYAKKGFDPMPVFMPQGKFRLVVGRNAYFTHGTTQNNTLLNELMAENTLWMNPGQAARLDLENGETVRVTSSVGVEKLRLEVTEKIRPDTVYMAHGFGVLSPQMTLIAGKGGCDAGLIEDRFCPISGNSALHETFVEVAKA
jgi:thiosulfate reductase/polysulfide reductase chain A